MQTPADSFSPSRISAVLLLFFAAGLLLLACSDSSETTAGSETVDPTPDTTTDAGADPDAGADGEAEATPTAIAVGTSVSFAEEVLPVITNSCARCHNEGGPGYAIWPLTTAADVANGVAFVSHAIDIGYMPPWPSSTLSVPFADNFALSADEKQAIAAWAAEGGQLDIDPATEIVAPDRSDILIDRDLVLTAAEGYAGEAAAVNDYRCQIHDLGITEPGYIQSMAFEPDQAAVVHHGVVFLAQAGLREQADRFDGRDGKPGWPCYTLDGLSPEDGARSRQILPWAPGQNPTRFPEGSGLFVEPGDFLVVQVHYNYTGLDEAPIDLSRMVIDMASDDEIAAAGGSLDLIYQDIYLGPAEIPCSSEQSGPLCDRNNVLEEIGRTYGMFSALIPNSLLQQCGLDLSYFDQFTDGRSTTSCDLTNQRTGDLIAVFGHMHELGDSYRITLHPDTPDEVVLLDIPRWDFEWQLNYQLEVPIQVQRGDILRIECTWDRARNPNDQPRWVTWSDGTDDEMCYGSLTVRQSE